MEEPLLCIEFQLTLNIRRAECREDPNLHGARKIKGDLCGDEFNYYGVICASHEEDYDVLVPRVRHWRDAYRGRCFYRGRSLAMKPFPNASQ